jgi:hypothetical protein
MILLRQVGDKNDRSLNFLLHSKLIDISKISTRQKLQLLALFIRSVILTHTRCMLKFVIWIKFTLHEYINGSKNLVEM